MTTDATLDLDAWLHPQSGELPRAEPDAVTGPFWESCAQGRLDVQRCTRCRAYTSPPLEHCRACLSREQVWETSSGRGRLFSWTVVTRPVTTAFSTPYAIAIVTLDEGWQMVSNIVNTTPRQLRLDLAVRAVFVEVSGDLVLPCFEPA